MTKITQRKKFTLRIENDVLEKISCMAKANCRSTNREIETAIRRHIRDFERLNGTIETKNANKK